MTVRIRQEKVEDIPLIHDLIGQAFESVLESDHKEQFLVDRLRGSETFVPQLSLVAETVNGVIAGYILLTEVEIVSQNSASVSLAVAPLAVHPEFQGKGIGGMLLEEAHKRAAMLGYGTAVLLGHKDYYTRFGYRKATDYGVEFPFDVPDEFCMIIELVPDAAHGICGTVRYPDSFFE